MNKPLLLSLAAAALLSTNLNAQSMLERFEAMEREMNKLKKEIATLKANKPAAAITSANEADEDEEEDEEKVASEDSAQESEDDAVRVVASAEDDEDEEDGEDIVSNEDRIFDLEEAVSQLNRNTSGSHLKFKIDYRFAIENMQYDLANGESSDNDAFMTNRLWINMGYKATNNLSFKGQLAYNKAFGQRSGISSTDGLEGFDWIANENAYDDQIRVRSAYFLWQDREFMGMDIPWTFSIGRRPSTGGHLVNLREDDKPNSPMGHSINVEFDGLSSRFTLNKEWGTSVKLCAGRGMSNAAAKFTNTPYAEVADDNTNIDLVGLIFVPYDNKQYSVATQYYYADNLIDQNALGGFDTVGGMHSITANFTVNGIGNEWSDFLDESTFFISAAASITNPKDGAPQGMLGSTSNETGTSFWVGTQFPSLLTEDGRWGLEYNHGSKYWRSITYAEDTNIGSKLATRGNAYEAYFTEYLVDDILSMQLRYTYIDYKYTGSNGFFGDMSGTPTRIISSTVDGNGDSVVDTAQDIRLYIRYRY